MQAALFVVLCVLAFVAGVVGHELTHWAVWRLLGRDARLVSVTVVECPHTGDLDARDTAAALAPLAAGVTVGGLALAAGVLVAVPLAVGLVIFTSTQDLSVAASGLSGDR
jgi:hypothetical protein